MKILINGKFLAQRTTGVQRYARELLKALDSALPRDGLEFFIAVPKDAKDVPECRNIRIVRKRAKASVFWDQVLMPLYAMALNAFGLHICNVGPILKPDFIFLHDAVVQRNPQWFTKKLVIWYGIVHRACAKMAKKVFTVSEFSKRELGHVFGISERRIVVIGNAWEHIEQVQSDASALGRFGLPEKGFYFSLGTKAPHKNLRWIFEYAEKHPDETFAISGSAYDRIFGKVQLKPLSNVHFLGYLSDSEVKALMQSCKAFLFTSFYEGFGMPPLEASGVGAKIIVSDIPVMREIFGNVAHYIDPGDTRVNLDELLRQPVDNPVPVLEKYSWKKCAERLLESLKEFSR